MNIEILKEKIELYEIEPVKVLSDKDLINYLHSQNIEHNIEIYEKNKDKESLEIIILTITLNVLILNNYNDNYNNNKTIKYLFNKILNKEIELEKTKHYFKYNLKEKKYNIFEHNLMCIFKEYEIIKNQEITDFLFLIIEEVIKNYKESQRRRFVEDYITLFENDMDKLIRMLALLEGCEKKGEIRKSSKFFSRGILEIIFSNKLIEFVPSSYYEGFFKELLKNKNYPYHNTLMNFVKKNQKFNIAMLRILIKSRYLDENIGSIFNFENFIDCFLKNREKIKSEFKSAEYISRIKLIEESINIKSEISNF